MESSRVSSRVSATVDSVGTESIGTRTAFDDLTRQLGDAALGHLFGALGTKQYRGGIDAADQIRSARRGIVVGRIVQSLYRDPQRRIPVGHLRIQLLDR